MVLPALTCLILVAILWWQHQRINQLMSSNEYLRKSLRRAHYLLFIHKIEI